MVVRLNEEESEAGVLLGATTVIGERERKAMDCGGGRLNGGGECRQMLLLFMQSREPCDPHLL